MKQFVIANPHARNGRSRHLLGRVRSELDRQGVAYRWAECESLDHARRLSAEANRAGYDAVVAAGGDGTINRVLNGFYDADGRRISCARFGVLHVGTSPDFCRSYGVPTEMHAAVQALGDGRTRSISVGRIVYGTGPAAPSDCPARTELFGCCANVGLGAALARRANGGIRRRVGDCLGTFLALLGTLRQHRPQTLQVALDGQERRVPGVLNVAIGRTRFIASGIKVHHELEPQDHRLYVLTLQNLSGRTILPMLWSIYRGRPLVRSPSLRLAYAQTVAVAASEGAVEVEFDGDPAGFCPCRITTAPDPIPLIVGGAS